MSSPTEVVAIDLGDLSVLLYDDSCDTPSPTTTTTTSPTTTTTTSASLTYGRLHAIIESVLHQSGYYSVPIQ